MNHSTLRKFVSFLLKPIVNTLLQIIGYPTVDNLQQNISYKDIQLQRLREQEATLLRVISKIRASLELEMIFETTTKETCKLLGVERIAVYKFDEDWGGEFISNFEFAEAGWNDSYKLGKNTVWNDSYLQEHKGGRYTRNQTFAVDDIRSGELSQCHIDILEQFQIRSYATAPIFVGQKLWGILAAYQHSRPYVWQSNELHFLSQVATQLGFAVKQATLLAEAEKKSRDLQDIYDRQQILFRLITKIRESLDLDTLFSTTAKEIRKALQVDRVGVYKFDLDSCYSQGEFVAESVLPDFDSVMKVQFQDHCFGEKYAPSYQKGKIQTIADIENADLQECHSRILQKLQVRAQIIVPLLKGDVLWGLLCIHQCQNTRDWQLIEIQFVEQIATHFSIALKHSELLAESHTKTKTLSETLIALQNANSQLEALTRVDSLTQIANRRYFDEILQQEWYRLLRQQRWLSLIIFDVDHFKAYNDFYGHPEGDRCLKQITQAVAKILKRTTDLFARYGGEEFAIVLPETELPNAIQVAQKVQQVVQELHIQQSISLFPHSFVTISLGVVSQIPSMESSPQSLVSAADKALYVAKASGRNQFSVYTSSQSGFTA